MSSLDTMNACFEGTGAVLTWLNVARLRKDREIKGVDWRVTAFWSGWGLFNLYYYYQVGHMLSWTAGACLVAGNITWVVTAMRLAWRKHQEAV